VAHYFNGPQVLAPAGSTGNKTLAGVWVQPGASRFCMQFVNEVLGATPTVDFQFQGSVDGGTTWTAVPYVTAASNTLATAAVTVTGLGATVLWMDLAVFSRFFSMFRCVTTNNTNVTYRAELYTEVV